MGNSEASLRRIGLAAQVAEAYRHNPKVSAVVIAGSVARGWADDFSDIEINIFWSEDPSDEERWAAMERAGGTSVSFQPYEDEEWSEVCTVHGVKIEVSQFRADTIERYMNEVYAAYDTSLEKQVVLAAIEHSVPIHGQAQVEAWKERLSFYPVPLAEAVIKAHLQFEGLWYYAPLAYRGDFVMLYDVMIDAIQHLYAVLYGLNRCLLAHPRCKWAVQQEERFAIAPANLNGRLWEVFQVDLAAGLGMLQGIVEETFLLIESEFPGIRIERPKPAAKYRLTNECGGSAATFS